MCALAQRAMCARMDVHCVVDLKALLHDPFRASVKISEVLMKRQPRVGMQEKIITVVVTALPVA